MFAVGVLKNGDVNLIPKYLLGKLWGRLYDIHTDSRNTGDFNPGRWNNCYHCIADLMKLQPRTVGLFGTSWFYDPALV